MKNLYNSILEEISSIWTLLNDTTIFLTRIKKFEEYEKEIWEWRKSLTQFSSNNNIRKQVRKEIIELRNSLRLQGYNLKLGSKDIELLGFRSDDVAGEGFKRIVIVLGKNYIYYKTGNENHLELLRFLAISMGYSDPYTFSNIHNLWYKWINNILTIYGADSESQEDYEKFKNFVSNNKDLLLKKLKNLF